MDEMAKLKAMLEEIQTSLKNGVVSVEDYNNKVKEILAEVEVLRLKQKDILEEMKKRNTAMSGLEDEKKKFSLLVAIKGIATGEWGDGYERDVMKEYRQKAMSTGTGSAGGYLVPPQAITDIIEMLRAETVVIQSGATIMDGLISSPVEIPSQTGGATAYWVAENSAITASDLTVGQITMTPHQVAALVKLSARLVNISNPGAEGLVRNDIALALAEAIDIAALRGSGVSNQPTGIVNYSGVLDLNLGASGKQANFIDMDKLAGLLEDENALRGNLGYIMHPKAKRLLRQERIANYSTQTDGSYVLLPMGDEDLSRIMAYPFKTTTQIPTNLTKGSGTNLTEIYFGNWREMLIAMWGGLMIESSSVAGDNTGGAFSSNQVWIRAIQEMDIQLRHAASFAFTNEAYSQA